jgi:hypothetical protein
MQYPQIGLGTAQVMPDHFCGILVIPVRAIHGLPLQGLPLQGPSSQGLPSQASSTPPSRGRLEVAALYVPTREGGLEPVFSADPESDRATGRRGSTGELPAKNG